MAGSEGHESRAPQDGDERPVISVQGQDFHMDPYEFLRQRLGADEALRASDGTRDGTYYFWFEVGQNNGLMWRNCDWTAGKPAEPVDARHVLTPDKTLQVVEKEAVA